MLLWYVWMHIVDGAWHKLDEISKQLRIPRNAVSWAAKFMGWWSWALKRMRSGCIRLS
jgi:hypothetical protein